MEQIELENILHRILYGIYYFKHNNISYKCVPNTLQDKYEAALIYQQVIQDMRYEEMLTWEQAQRVSEVSGIWTVKDEAGMKDLEKMVENTKLQLYLNHTNPQSVQQLKKKLKQIQTGISKSNMTKHRLYHATKESHAENVRREYLVAVSIRDKFDNQLYNIDNFWDCDNTIIQCASENANDFGINKIRKIARSEPWRSMWIAQKGECIGKPSVEWTEHQRILCSFSKMYDNVYESTECPPDEVIEDDDILDGWFVKQRKDREEAKKEKSTDHNFGTHKGKGNQEMYIMAHNKDQASTIMNTNDATGKNIVNTRKQVVENAQGEKIDDIKMPDVQRDLQMQAVQDMREKIKGR
jgi:hypothetical protein